MYAPGVGLMSAFGRKQTFGLILNRCFLTSALEKKAVIQLSFLPVRMEQQKNGRTEMVFILKSVEGL